MKDINMLTGIEFENLCQILLQKAGFDVETTKISGDGGIDLIAYNHKPFFSGKYIIQCKRYTGSVGEPIVRDLYGVVMAERANKGILLTTGHFTISAARFASDKNIELIDGEMLGALLTEHDLAEDNKPTKYNHFTQFECFDKRKYDFYKTMINQNMCTFEMGHTYLFEFMFEYMKTACTNEKISEMLQAGFVEEYLNAFSWYTGKYFKRGKDKIDSIPYYVNKYKGIAQLLNFDLFEYVQNRYAMLTGTCDMDIFLSYPYGGRNGREYYTCNLAGLHNKSMLKDHAVPSFAGSEYEVFSQLIRRNLRNKEKTLLLIDKQEYTFFELMNLFSLFAHFRIQKGVELIVKLLCGDTPEFKGWIENQDVCQTARSSLQIYYCDIHSCVEGKKYIKTDLNYEGYINLDSYYARYEDAHREKIAGEIDKIEKLLDTLI